MLYAVVSILRTLRVVRIEVCISLDLLSQFAPIVMVLLSGTVLFEYMNILTVQCFGPKLVCEIQDLVMQSVAACRRILAASSCLFLAGSTVSC